MKYSCYFYSPRNMVVPRLDVQLRNWEIEESSLFEGDWKQPWMTKLRALYSVVSCLGRVIFPASQWLAKCTCIPGTSIRKKHNKFAEFRLPARKNARGVSGCGTREPWIHRWDRSARLLLEQWALLLPVYVPVLRGPSRETYFIFPSGAHFAWNFAPSCHELRSFQQEQ